MALSAPKREQIESYWTQYFRYLDKLAPHDSNSRAAAFDVARDVTCFACKDGTLCWFAKGPTLNILHHSSGITVETMFNKLSNPAEVNFKDRFPDAHDFGPVNVGEVAPGETTTVSVFFYRAVWGRGTVLGTSESPETQAIQDHQPEKGNRGIAIGPVTKTEKTKQ